MLTTRAQKLLEDVVYHGSLKIGGTFRNREITDKWCGAICVKEKGNLENCFCVETYPWPDSRNTTLVYMVKFIESYDPNWINIIVDGEAFYSPFNNKRPKHLDNDGIRVCLKNLRKAKKDVLYWLKTGFLYEEWTTA